MKKKANLLNEMAMANENLLTLRCLDSTVFPANIQKHVNVRFKL